MKKRWVVCCLLIPVLLVLVFRVYVMTHSTDILPIDDTDLLLIRSDVSPRDNAYPIFADATNVLYFPEGYGLDGYLWGDDRSLETASHDQVVSLLESNKLFFTAIEVGAQKEYCFRKQHAQRPILAREFGRMNRVLLTKIKFLIEEGENDEALAIAQLSLRFGQLIERDAEYIIEALIGISIISQSLDFIEKIVDQHDLSADQAEELVDQLSKMERLRSGLANGYKSEYAVMSNESIHLWESIQKKKHSMLFGKSITAHRYAFKPNQTRKVLAGYWRRQINRLFDPDHVQDQEDTVQYALPERWFGKNMYFLQENSIGKVLIFYALANNFSGLHEEIYATEKKVSDLKTKLLTCTTAADMSEVDVGFNTHQNRGMSQ